MGVVVVWEKIVNPDLPCSTCAPYVGTVHRQGEGPQPPFHKHCRCYRVTVEIDVEEEEEGMDHEEHEGYEGHEGKAAVSGVLDGAPMRLGALMVGGVPLDEGRRGTLLDELDVGTLRSLEVGIVPFLAEFPNRNFYRFREEDLAGFAASFEGQPFLRNHATGDIANRDGTILVSVLDGVAVRQTVRLTTQRGIRSFLEGQIDRFSIGWFYTGVTCSVCGQDWFGQGCNHWPGHEYKDGKGTSLGVCELIFEGPTGKETSAVNVPAVPGTHIVSVLCEQKERGMKKGMGDLGSVETQDFASVRDGVEAVEAGLAAGAEVVGLTKAAPADAWGAYLRATAINAALAASKLPQASQAVIRDQIKESDDPGVLDGLIAQQRALVAALREKDVVKGVVAGVGGMVTGLDRVSGALEALIEGRRPGNGIAPLSGIREAYVLLSGDYEMTGMFQADNVGLANVDSSTMAGVVANALNKVVVNRFQTYPRWWEPIVTVESFSSLQTVKWITLGGVGELPTVSEGAAYTELTWDDQTEVGTWVKKGGYLGLTLEAIDKDDTRRLQQAPRALAQSAWLTLGKAISSIFTVGSGVGPTLSDGTVLFHANHNNLGTTALSYAAWEATRAAMRKQTELNSGERLGGLVAPKYLLVPPDLEGTALQMLLSEGEMGTANNDENPWAEGASRDARLASAQRRVIVMDLWTDTNNWAVVADPNLYPAIGLGYRYGQTPEIFSVASPTSGLMFTNDVMPVKVRFFFAAGPSDWRGMYKHNVA